MSRDAQTKDGRFKGQKYECAICGQTYRKREMIVQRGKLVCRETCIDERAFKDRRGVS